MGCPEELLANLDRMFYNGGMDAASQLSLLSQDMNLEPDAVHETACQPVVNGRPVDVPISALQMPGGRQLKVLKTLITSACERDCYYCPFRAGRDMRRATFKPDQLADVFMELHRTGQVEGLFLSSGITGGGVRTQDKLIDTAEILRKKRGYRGYIHLKIMPGAEKDQVRRAMQLSNRLSVNLEAPNTNRLQMLAPHKAFTEELLQPLEWIEAIRREESPHRSWNGRWPSTTTQFVIGAVGESDLEIIQTSEHLYSRLGLQRAYFSAFRPVRDTPLEDLAPADPLRQHRLYQSSFLLRDYGFGLEDMPFDTDGNLPLSVDPKQAWAEDNLRHTPIEVNTADRRRLMQIPGIGLRSAAAIEQNRRLNKIASLSDLRKLGIRADRAAPYILLNGVRPARQLTLF